MLYLIAILRYFNLSISFFCYFKLVLRDIWEANILLVALQIQIPDNKGLEAESHRWHCWFDNKNFASLVLTV